MADTTVRDENPSITPVNNVCSEEGYCGCKEDKCCEELTFTSQDLLDYLRATEESSEEPEKYYALFHLNEKVGLNDRLFKAKTPCGAVLKIYRYMQDKEIPLWSGSNMGDLSSEITDLIYGEPAYDLIKFKELCEEWIDDHTYYLNKVEIV